MYHVKSWTPLVFSRNRKWDRLVVDSMQVTVGCSQSRHGSETPEVERERNQNSSFEGISELLLNQ